MGSKKSRRPVRSRLPLYLTLASLALGGTLYSLYQLTLNQAQPVDIMELSPSSQIVSLTLSPAGSNTVQVAINPNATKVTAAQLSLRFDPAQLGTPTVRLNDFFSRTLGEIKVKDGVLTFAAIVPVESGGKDTPGQLATITFSRQPTAPTTVTLTEDSMVVAVGYTTNLLKAGSSLSLTPPSTTTPTPTSTPRANAPSAPPITPTPSPATRPTSPITSPSAVDSPVASPTTPSAITPLPTLPNARKSRSLSPPLAPPSSLVSSRSYNQFFDGKINFGGLCLIPCFVRSPFSLSRSAYLPESGCMATQTTQRRSRSRRSPPLVSP